MNQETIRALLHFGIVVALPEPNIIRSTTNSEVVRQRLWNTFALSRYEHPIEPRDAFPQAESFTS